MPAPRQADLQKFLEEMSAPSGTTKTNTANDIGSNGSGTSSNEKSGVSERIGEKEAAAQSPTEEAAKPKRKEWLLNQAIQRDSPFVSKIALWVAHTFNDNPRRLKQFINLFRLRLHIASNTGLLDEVDGEKPALTAEQLGKLTALQLRWPDFVDAWLADPDLLKGLQQAAVSESIPDTDDPWFGDSELRALLRLDTKSAAASAGVTLTPNVSLEDVSLDTVLRVAPIRVSTAKSDDAGNILRRLAAEYEDIRETMLSGSDRTRAMTTKFRQMQQAVNRDVPVSEEAIRKLFQGTPGDRIVALAATSTKQSLSSFEFVVDSIETPRTPFEQYHALKCAEVLLPQMNQEQRYRLVSALKHALSTNIPPDDSSRWNLAGSIMAELDGGSTTKHRPEPPVAAPR